MSPDSSPANVETVSNKWAICIPWFLSLSSTMALVAIGWFLISNLEWFKYQSLKGSAQLPIEFQLHIFHLHLSMVKRSVGLFSGFAVMFLGLAVAFFTVRNPARLDLQTQSVTAKLVTASPGIVAMLIGMSIIMFAIQSKDEFPGYYKSNDSENVLRMPDKPE